MSHKKFGPDWFSRFDIYWIQTNKQTDKPNLYIDSFWSSFSRPDVVAIVQKSYKHKGSRKLVASPLVALPLSFSGLSMTLEILESM